jgi:hypothetical protein
VSGGISFTLSEIPPSVAETLAAIRGLRFGLSFYAHRRFEQLARCARSVYRARHAE